MIKVIRVNLVYGILCSSFEIIYIIYSEEENHLQDKIKKAINQKKVQHNNIIWFRCVKLLHVAICTYNINA